MTLSKNWSQRLKNHGIDPAKIKHDDTEWFYNGKDICVGYGGVFTEKCPYFSTYCSGGDTYGDYEQQIESIIHAIENKGSHPSCPLIYPGAK